MTKKQIYLLISVLIGCIIIFTTSLLRKNNDAIRIYSPEEQREINGIPRQTNADFIWTRDEQLAITKWKNSSFEALFSDAINGDPAALWMVGMGFLTGSNELPLDTDTANGFFAQSASLGFGPAIEQMYKIHSNELNNPFLCLVYVNLAICVGHKELIYHYHKMLSDLIASGGKNIACVIEKIASHKYNFIKNFSHTCKLLGLKKTLDLYGLIDSTDCVFSSNFWAHVFSEKIDIQTVDKLLSELDSLKVAKQ